MHRNSKKYYYPQLFPNGIPMGDPEYMNQYIDVTSKPEDYNIGDLSQKINSYDYYTNNNSIDNPINKRILQQYKSRNSLKPALIKKPASPKESKASKKPVSPKKSAKIDGIPNNFVSEKLAEKSGFKFSKKYANGVNKIRYYQNESLDLQILIFSDIHNNEGKCNTYGLKPKDSILGRNMIKELLDYNEKESNNILDIFIEYKPTGNKKVSFNPSNSLPKGKLKKKRFRNNVELDMTNKFLHPCINMSDYAIVSEDCSYNYSRIHYTDFRDNFSGMDIAMISFFFNQQAINTIEMHEDETIDRMINNPMEYFNDIISIPKMKKQFDAIVDVNLRDQIIDYFKDLITQYKNQYDDGKSTNRLFSYLVNVLSLIMDMYLIGRLFKTFSKTELHSREHHNDRVNRAIIYAGLHHCNVYADLFERLEFQKLFETGENGRDKCLYIEDLTIMF
jgi:hypothetical protein